MTKAISRMRSRLGPAVLILAAAGAGCGQDGSPARATQVAPDEAVSPARPGAALNSAPEIEAARQATARFHDPAAALAAGYRTDNPNEPCVQSPLGVMGIHAPNFQLMADQAIEATRPELLLYAPTSDGGRRLVGVEYMRFVLVRNPATGEVGPWISPNPWPPDYEVVNERPRLFGVAFDGPMPGHTPTMPWHWDFHAWIWAPNPSGMFAQFNPALSCG